MQVLQPKRRDAGGIMALVLIVTGIVVFGFLTAPLFTLMASIAAPSSSGHRVTYKISTNRDWGSCYGFDTTYEMPHGTAQKPVSICDGATSTLVATRSGARGDFVYLSVQNDRQSARIGCQIYIDGKLTFHTFSEGQYVIASCSGSIP